LGKETWFSKVAGFCFGKGDMVFQVAGFVLGKETWFSRLQDFYLGKEA
jgi:uncharacterized protein YfiM (DUF2279 family)